MCKRLGSGRPISASSTQATLTTSIARYFAISVLLLNSHLLIAAQDGPDQDGDGIINQLDLDDENDGILDVDEGIIDLDNNGVADAESTDTDGDGTPDGYDLDSDNDGILDNLEARLDRQAVKALDQVPDGAIDTSVFVGANGVADAIETHPDSAQLTYPLSDTDQDGIADFRDLDSDNDGIFDVIEAGAQDADGNGRIDAFADVDGKGVSDTIQSTGLPIFDTDGDGQLDFRDLDSDGDGIADLVESGGNPSKPIDSDNDGAADYRELDSDGDGLSDNNEAGVDLSSPIDSNGNGIADYREPNQAIDLSDGPDRDADGIANQYDLDDDNDGIPDSVEGLVDADGNGVADANSRDTDGDGRPDANDLDSDNDGILDNREARLDSSAVSALDQVVDGAIDRQFPVGNNGLADAIETSKDSGVLAYAIVDTDADGVPDYLDPDSDNDGIPDLVEAGGLDADLDGRIDGFFDSDSKGVDDAVQASALPVFDTDGDGRADYRDTDSDNDGLSDKVEAGENPGKPTDTDSDGAADYRELDSDGDGVKDGQQQPFLDANDADGDGVADNIDLDDDNDGLLDSIEGWGDNDGDGNLNRFDLDSDGDGLFDWLEAYRNTNILKGLDQDNDGRLDSVVGGNGFVDVLESTLDSGTSTFSVADSDLDGLEDFLDLDSDNDSIYDSVESSGDFDRDALANFRDVDSDQDGLSDLLEMRGDTLDLVTLDRDRNGVLDAISDANVDGADDSSASVQLLDTDSDGMPDYLDLDSDGDGVFDLVESGGKDANYNGRVDSLDDTDGDFIPDGVDIDFTSGVDTDNDGIDDMADVSFTGGFDTDSDGIDDKYDSDQDGNGFVDPGLVETISGQEVQEIVVGDDPLETGLSGSSVGCAIGSRGNGSDPILMLLLGAAFMTLLSRTRKLRNVAALSMLSLSLAACGSLDLGRFGGGGSTSDSDFNRRVYVGLAGLASTVEPKSTDGDITITENSSAGGTVQLGYDISNRFSIEGHYSDLGEAELSPNGTIAYQVGGLSAIVYGLNDHEDRSRREGFSVFGRLGAGTMRNQATGVGFERLNDVHFLAGLGLEYGLSNGLGVRAEYVAHEKDAKYAQLGLVYRFGDAGESAIAAVAAPAVAALPAATEVSPPIAAAPLDSDSDGVVNTFDQCPNTAAGVPVDANGCDVLSGTIEGVNFESGSDKLTSGAKQKLDEVAQVLGQYPTIQVAIAAHTDNQGAAAGNLQLSKRRALAVARYLVEQGVAGNRLRPQAYGESQPLTSNSTASGRASNRRVEMQVVQ